MRKGGGMGLLVLVGACFWLWSRRGSAAAAPALPPAGGMETMPRVTGWRGTRADVEAGMAQAERDMETDQSRAAAVLGRWGALLGRYPRPIPPQLAALVIARESGGDPNAVAGDPVLGERGLWQLSRDEASAAGVADPFNPETSTAGAQQLYRSAIRAMREPDAESQLVVALLSRSIGLGDARRLRSLVPPGTGQTFAQRLRVYVEGAQGMPASMAGRIGAEMWARRVYRGLLRAETAVTLAWVSATADLSA